MTNSPGDGQPQRPHLTVAVLDVGSVRPLKGLPRLGWCSRRVGSGEERVGATLGALVDTAVEELADGRQVALGFECPLWVPLPGPQDELGRGRSGVDGNRAWSAGAGAGVLATGIQQCAWVLAELARRKPAALSPTFSWSELAGGSANLLIFEAFVSGAAKAAADAERHIADARAAVLEFVRRIDEDALAAAPPADAPFNLAAACLLRARLLRDPGALASPCLIVKAPTPHASPA